MANQELTRKLIDLRQLNDDRRAMLERLSCLGRDFPDADIALVFDALRKITEQRMAATADELDALEAQAEEVAQSI